MSEARAAGVHCKTIAGIVALGGGVSGLVVAFAIRRGAGTPDDPRSMPYLGLGLAVTAAALLVGFLLWVLSTVVLAWVAIHSAPIAETPAPTPTPGMAS